MLGKQTPPSYALSEGGFVVVSGNIGGWEGTGIQCAIVLNLSGD